MPFALALAAHLGFIVRQVAFLLPRLGKPTRLQRRRMRRRQAGLPWHP